MFSFSPSSCRSWLLASVAVLTGVLASAQVASYTFSAAQGTWQPIAGNGTPMGMPGLPPPFTFDDNSFVTQGDNLPLGSAVTGNGWPIGFNFNFNGHTYDRVGLSMEGWLAFGNSIDGINAVYVPTGPDAYSPLSSALPVGMDPLKRDRVAGFSMDLAALGNGGTWPIQIITAGTAPNRYFVAEWNVVRSGGSNVMNFQIRLNEGGGEPASQTVQVVFGSMTQTSALLGHVGLGGDAPSDYNARAVGTSPYDWLQSQAGSSNAATCRPPSSATYLPQGLTFTWSPPGCLVTGIAVTDLAINAGNITGTLSWSPVTGANSYDYIITAGASSDPVILSGTGITGTSAPLSGLPAGQPLTAYVRADCGSGAQGWGAGNSFSTEGIIEVVCGELPVASNYCYHNLEEKTWSYTSSTGDPLRLMIHEGTIFSGDLLTVHDGPTAQSPILFSSANGSIAGQVVNSTGGHLTMKLITDENGSCETQDFIPPMEWEVGCLDCDPVQANFMVVDDCANGRFTVNVQIFGMGSATSVVINNDGSAAMVIANAPGQYTVGPFSNGTPVIVTAGNPDNAYCSSVSTALVNGTCPIVSCGPDTYTYCYTDNDISQRAYQSNDNGRIGIRFLSGTIASGDVIRIYDGLDPFMSAPLFVGSNNGNLNGLMVTTGLSNPDHALLLEVGSNASGSCATGQATPWNYVVACYDGCMPPVATFTTVPDCGQGTFSVSVNMTSLGSAASLNLINNGGASSQTVSAVGTYAIGPFPVGQQVLVEVQGGSLLCSLNSDTLTEACEVGIGEQIMNQMHVFPNPGDGTFRLVFPKGFGGQNRLEVLDITGRSVAVRMLQNNSGPGVDCDLGYLPAGRYTLILDNGKNKAFAPISIMR